MTAMFLPLDRREQGESRYTQFDQLFANCDLILVEGDVQASAPRVEVWRRESGEAPYAADDVTIVAVISAEAPSGLKCPVWPRGDMSLIADRIQQLAEQGR